MGDLVDITTVPHQMNAFYKLTSGSLRFQVKGSSSAGIGLSTNPYGSSVLWFIIGRDGITSVTKDQKSLHAVQTPITSTLTAHEFNEFWIQWHDDMICFGNDYAIDPFITFCHKTVDLKYVTFAVASNDQYPLQWRFEMPPFREQLKIKSVSNGMPQWIPANDQLPDGALIGGYENELLYIIRAKHRNSVTPGKFVSSHGLGYIPWGGGSHEKNELEVLCGYDCMWIPCSKGRVPAGSVEAGYSEEDYEPLYVGRGICEGHLIPGKVQPSHKVCYVPFNDREFAISQYEILVVPHKNAQCTNPFFMYDRATRMCSAPHV